MVEKIDETKRAPYRVAVWGPGSVGVAAIRELLLLPETQLVSVLAYDKAKDKIDAGTLVGSKPAGVAVTTEVSQLLAAKPECVLYTARDYGDGRNEDDIVMLLKAGINVITVLAYQYPQMRGEAVVHRITEAAKAGGATFFATGINPGFMFDRLAMLMTGLSNDIEYMALSEFLNCEAMPGAGTFLQLMGFGMKQVDRETTERTAALVQSYLAQNLHFVAEKLGKKIERIEREDRHENATTDIVLPDVMTIKAGTVARLSFRWIAFSGDKPFLSVQSNWYVTERMRPPQVAGKADDYWVVEIEGRPSTRVSMEVCGSLDGRLKKNATNPSNLSYLVTAIPVIQAIPAVIAAAPGILTLEAPQFHWKAGHAVVTVV